MLPPPMTTQIWTPELVDFLHLLAGALEGGGVDRVAGLAAAQDLAGELEDDALVFHPGIHGLGVRAWARMKRLGK